MSFDSKLVMSIQALELVVIAVLFFMWMVKRDSAAYFEARSRRMEDERNEARNSLYDVRQKLNDLQALHAKAAQATNELDTMFRPRIGSAS